MKCAACGFEFKPVDNRIGRRDSCSKCGADLHSCVNCQFYDRSAYNECHEPQADRVQEKDRANFCDYYSARTDGGPSGPKAPSKDDLKAKADALFNFGKKPSS